MSLRGIGLIRLRIEIIGEPSNLWSGLLYLKKKSIDVSQVRTREPVALRWAGHVARMEEGRCAFKILTGKPIGKRPLGRSRCRWEDSAQDKYYWRALVSAALSLRVP